jgi:hypothetical protein
VHDQVLWSVVLSSAEIAVEDSLCAVGVTLLGVDRGSADVGHHGVSSAKGVLGVAERVVFGRGLGEPDVSSVAAEVPGLEGLGDVFLDDDGAAGGVDEP